MKRGNFSKIGSYRNVRKVKHVFAEFHRHPLIRESGKSFHYYFHLLASQGSMIYLGQAWVAWESFISEFLCFLPQGQENRTAVFKTYLRASLLKGMNSSKQLKKCANYVLMTGCCCLFVVPSVSQGQILLEGKVCLACARKTSVLWTRSCATSPQRQMGLL